LLAMRHAVALDQERAYRVQLLVEANDAAQMTTP